MTFYFLFILFDIFFVIQALYPTIVAKQPLAYINFAYDTTFVIFPAIQAFGLCVFKPSNDPLSEVSTLSYLKMVSRN